MRAFARKLLGASDDEAAPTPPRPSTDGNVVRREGSNTRPAPSADEELRQYTRHLLRGVAPWDHPNL